MGENNLTELGKALADLREDDVESMVTQAIEEKRPPLKIIDELSDGMDAVGALFNQEEYFLSELIFSGEIFKKAMERLKPIIESGGGREVSGKVVLGTVKGDVHDLGKNIVATLLECAGFEVVNLGVDVVPEGFVQALKDSQAPVLGLSGLITTAFGSMKETVEAITKAGLRDSVKIMIGGGPTSEEVKVHAGADFFGRDATAAVEFAKSVVGK